MPVIPRDRAGRGTIYTSGLITYSSGQKIQTTKRIRPDWDFILREIRFFGTGRFKFNLYTSANNTLLFNDDIDSRASTDTNDRMVNPIYFWPGYIFDQSSEIRYDVTDTSNAENKVEIQGHGEEFPHVESE